MSLTEENPAEPMPNLPLLRKVLDHVDAHPDEWRQETWATKTACGTAFCIAGHVSVMAGGVPLFRGGTLASEARLPDGTVVDICTHAADELGIDVDEADSIGGLFYGENNRADVQRVAEGIAARAGERL